MATVIAAKGNQLFTLINNMNPDKLIPYTIDNYGTPSIVYLSPDNYYAIQNQLAGTVTINAVPENKQPEGSPIAGMEIEDSQF